MEDVTGHSAEYKLLARSLHLALKDYFTFFEQLPDHLKADADHVPNLESRLLTVVLLSAALSECCINVILASKLPEVAFELIERSSPEDKWMKAPKLFAADYEFPIGTALNEDLRFVFSCRNAIMHSKPDIFSSTDVRTRGNFDRVLELKHSRLSRLVSLPRRLVEHVARLETRWAPFIGVIIDSELRLREFDRYFTPSHKAT